METNFKMNTKLFPTWDYLLLISVLLMLNAQCEAIQYYNTSMYARMRHYFPKVSNSETSSWGMVEDDANGAQHPCKRKCVENEPMTCYYYLVVHYDQTMGTNCQRYLDPKHHYRIGNQKYIDALSVFDYDGFDDCKYADGTKFDVMVVNGRLPGQSIEVCYGDTVVADVINSMHEVTTIHWHGIKQHKTPHMDGVGHVTQYPIEPGQAFRYRFEVDNTGTHWWHSHTGHHRGLGLAGPLIVREPKARNPHAQLYDFDLSEHVITIQDWVYNFDDRTPDNILINGLGRNVRTTRNVTKEPILYATFKVIRGGRYRFRAIFNGIAHCPLSLSIDGHDLLVIASDGNDIEPVTVQTLTFTGGERFDFVLHANQDVDRYWLRVKGYDFCAINKLHQEAIIHYVGANVKSIPKGVHYYDYSREGIELNSIHDPATAGRNILTLANLNAIEQRIEPPMRISSSYYTSMIANTRTNFIFQMDDITFTMPQVSLLQARNLGINNIFCNKTERAAMGFNCRSEHCRCTNVIEVPAYKQIEFVISSLTESAHPIHLHGYIFRVVGMGILGADRIRRIEEIDRQTPLPRRKRGAPLKDTVQVPALGYTIIRFYSDNPGYWSFHCHVSTHAENGMKAIVRVGENEQMKMCPVSNCGLCSSVL